MSPLLVIVPSRGRPAAVPALAAAFRETCTANTRLVFAVDNDDPEIFVYNEAVALEAARVPFGTIRLWVNEGPKTMVAALNGAVTDLLGTALTLPEAVAFMGDDHRPRTRSWDRDYLKALRELGTGIVYGDDLLQGERIPTQVAMTVDIIQTLGFMCPPTLTHLFVDNYWRDLGHGAGCLRYLPDVVVEHLHPFANKALWDAGHMRVNAPEMYQADQLAYTAYAAAHLADDVAKVKALR